MRRRIAHGLMIGALIVGLRAAQGPNNSEASSAESSSAQIKPEIQKTAVKAHPYQIGTASWYGEDFEGKQTASGEDYEMYDMTAAHPTLPLGSLVKVTNLRNGRAVVVKVNDRGPIVQGRIIDLSYGAAQALQFHNRGLQKVRLDLVKAGTSQHRPILQTIADNRAGFLATLWRKSAESSTLLGMHVTVPHPIPGSVPEPASSEHSPRQSAREKLIVALDVSSAAVAQKIVAALGDSVLTYKVGMQLYTAEGPQVVRDLAASGRSVFLDLKYHDIPNTVASAVHEAARLGVGMLTVHASGSAKMLKAAADAARAVNPKLVVLAVTVLTSMGEDDLGKIGVQGTVLDEVLRLAKLALDNGCKGIVSSARESAALRKEFGHNFAIVTPGVRMAGSGHEDQVRVVTPAEAIAAGASHIVVGRPITEAPDPAAAAREILGQMSA